MKKLLAIALLTSSLYATAQVSSADDPITPEFRRFRFGLQFSPNISWIKPDTKFYEKGKSGLSFSYGIMTEFSLSKNYAFLTGLSITGMKAGLKYPGVYKLVSDTATTYYPSFTDAFFKAKYINLPLQLKMKTNQIGYITYYGIFGFHLGAKYQVKADFTYKKTGLSPDPVTEDADYTKNLSLIRTALVIGGGIEYNISGNTNIIIGFTFNNGFSNVHSSKNFKVYQTDSQGNVVFDQNNQPIEDTEKSVKAVSNYLSLDLGIFF